MSCTQLRDCSFGCDVPKACFCGFHIENPDHLFFYCPLAQSGASWIQSLLVLASPLVPSIEVRHMLFGFLSNEFRCVPRVFAYLLNVCKFLIWSQHNDYHFRAIPPVPLGFWRLSRLGSLSICSCFSNVLSRVPASVF